MALYILAPDPNGTCCDCSTRPNPCDLCTPSVCTCYFGFPAPLSNPVQGPGIIFDDANQAQNALNESCVDCYTISRGSQTAAGPPNGVGANSISSSVVGTVNATYGSYGSGLKRLTNSNNYIAIQLKAGDIVPISFNVSTNAGFTAGTPTCSNGINLRSVLTVYDCNGGSVVWDGEGPSLTYCDQSQGLVNVSGPSVSGTMTGVGIYSGNFVAPSDSIYFFMVVYTYGAQGGTLNVSTSSTVTTITGFTIPSGRTAIPVSAFFIDSDFITLDQLQACPRTAIPFGAEWNAASPYSNLSVAQSSIDNNVINCIGYFSPDSGSFSSRSASGGSTLHLAWTATGTSPSGEAIGSINVEESDTITMTYAATCNGGGVGQGDLRIGIGLYDANGNLVFTDLDLNHTNSLSGSFTSTSAADSRAHHFHQYSHLVSPMFQVAEHLSMRAAILTPRRSRGHGVFSLDSHQQVSFSYQRLIRKV